MFSVVVENDFEANWFTEKIVDAFRTYTVPIYLGAPKIGRYFDEGGIIIVKDADELIGATNRLTVEDYWLRMPAMSRNYEAAQPYMNLLENLRTYIQEAFDRKGR